MFNYSTSAQIVFKILLCAAFLALQSCQKEEIVFTKSYPNVDEELWQYFEKFEMEGNARGLSIDLIASGITGKIGATSEAMWVGQCNHNANQPNEVIINFNFWNSASKLRKEKIVFHELGHCFLGRSHNNEINEDGTCKSLMREGTGSCMDNYTEESKVEYCNELFTF